MTNEIATTANGGVVGDGCSCTTCKEWAHMGPLQYLDSRAFPHCLVANKPQRTRRAAVRRIPEQPKPAGSMAELRAWLATDEHWLNLSRWSRGIPALATPVRSRRVDNLTHPERMTADEIDATCAQEIPTISREAFEDIGVQALSLDAARRFDDEPDAGTIGEAIGAEAMGLLIAELDDSDLDPVWADALEYAEDNLDLRGFDDRDEGINTLAHEYVAEQIDALRNAMAYRYGTAYDMPSPDVRDRIEWEQFITRCSEISREGFRILPDRVEVFSWSKTDRRPLAQRTADVVARFLAEHGLDALPKLDDWHKRRNILRALKTNPRVLEPNRIEFEHHLATMQARAAWTDDDAGMSAEIMDEPYVPSLALITYQFVQRAMEPFRHRNADWADWPAEKAVARARALEHWQTLRRSAGDPVRKHVCRNPKQHGGKDEPWHALPPQPDVDAPVVLLGEVLTPEAA